MAGRGEGLRNALEERLERAGKLEWAHEEFRALLHFAGPAVRTEPWRRTSGIHKVRGPRRLALVRSLWEARDAIARERDVTPGRILNDAAIVTIARTAPASRQELRDLEVMRSRGARLAPTPETTAKPPMASLKSRNESSL